MSDLLQHLKDALAERYTIEDELGRGGMATVYRAHDKRHARAVAIKVLLPELAASLGPERFRQEITLAAGLTHPHILPIHDSGEADGLLYYVMPLVDGESLRDRLVREKQLSIEEATRITLDIVGAVGYAHNRGIVHRDIKPENIMFAAGHAVLTDFGIARAITAAGGERLTQTGIAIGTPAYMSPEQASGASDVDGRSDLYALGCVLYEMLSGHPPFVGTTAQEVMFRHATDPVPSIRAARPTIPHNIEVAIAQALEKTPADRFATAEHFTAALTGAGGAGPPAAEAEVVPHPPAVSSPGLRRFTRAVVIALVAAMVIAGGVWIAGKDGFLASLVGSRAQPLNPRRAVVAVFDNLTGDPELDHLGRMAADWAAQGLSRLDSLDVVPGIVALRFDRTDASQDRERTERERIRALAEETKAGMVISGAYYLARDTIHFQTRISDARADTLLHDLEPVSGPHTAPMQAVQDLRQHLMGAVAVVLDQDLTVSSFALSGRPPRYDAYREYLIGSDYWMIDFPRAIGHYMRAIRLDSTFLLPWASIAIAQTIQGRRASADSIFRMLNQNREQLPSLQRHLLDGFTASMRHQHREAIGALLAADRVDSKNLMVKHFLGVFAKAANQPMLTVQAYGELERAYEPEVLFDSPIFWLHFEHLTQALHMLGRYDDEVAEARRARQYYPDVLDVRWYEARALIALERQDEVRDVVRDLLNNRYRPGRGFTVPTVMRRVALEFRAHGDLQSGRYFGEQALAWSQENPDLDGPGGMAASLLVNEQWDEARSAYRELAAAQPDVEYYRVTLGELAAMQGDTATALRISAELSELDLPYNSANPFAWQAGIAALLGDREGATELLERYFALGGHYYRLHRAQAFAPLRDYPPFQDLMWPRR